MSDQSAADRAQQERLNIFGGLVAIGVILLLYLLVYSLVYVKIPTENATNLAQIIGAVTLQVGIIVGWFFRSSQEAKKQADTISTLVTSQAKAQDKLAPVPGANVPDNTVVLPAGDTVAVHAEGETKP